MDYPHCTNPSIHAPHHSSTLSPCATKESWVREATIVGDFVWWVKAPTLLCISGFLSGKRADKYNAHFTQKVTLPFGQYLFSYNDTATQLTGKEFGHIAKLTFSVHVWGRFVKATFQLFAWCLEAAKWWGRMAGREKDSVVAIISFFLGCCRPLQDDLQHASCSRLGSIVTAEQCPRVLKSAFR